VSEGGREEDQRKCAQRSFDSVFFPHPKRHQTNGKFLQNSNLEIPSLFSLMQRRENFKYDFANILVLETTTVQQSYQI
jgi:hypothetical protein